MLSEFFGGLFDTTGASSIEPAQFFICLGVSLAAGIVLSLMAMWKTEGSKSLGITLAVLPVVVCVVILMVNGNIGAGVAVGGAFSLVRFRSSPGTAREIAALFAAMGVGLITGMGYLAYAGLFALVMGIILMACNAFAAKKGNGPVKKILKITIPEDLDYCGVFDRVFEKYVSTYELVKMKTTNMGSMYNLTYEVVMKNKNEEKAFLDELRIRNGNLEIALSVAEFDKNRL